MINIYFEDKVIGLASAVKNINENTNGNWFEISRLRFDKKHLLNVFTTDSGIYKDAQKLPVQIEYENGKFLKNCWVENAHKSFSMADTFVVEDVKFSFEEMDK